MRSILILFTSNYPYGSDESYIESEITYLSSAFETVYIISNNTTMGAARSVPENVRVLSRPYELSFLEKMLSITHLFNPLFWEEMIFARNVYLIKINRLIIYTVFQAIAKSFYIEKFLLKNIPEELTDNVVCYSYWANDNATSIALMKKRGYRFKAICRAHRWDIYFEKNTSRYLPFRKILSKYLNAMYFVSEDGLKYFKAKTAVSHDNLAVSRLGVYPLSCNSFKPVTPDLHLLSCSYIIDRKRVKRIAEALSIISSDLTICWTHIGDGPLLQELIQLSSKIMSENKNIQINIRGAMNNSEVKQFYTNNYIDVFLNVSESEGVPVSIMEAMSGGIPTIATAVDGTSEIVIHGYNGYLIAKDFETQELAETISKFNSMSLDQIAVFRKNAFNTWLNNYDAEKNYSAFTDSLLSF